MPLIYCPECENQVSEYAEKCIHCGYPINPKPIPTPQSVPAPIIKHRSRNGCLTYFFIALGVVLIFVVLFDVFGRKDKSSSSSIINNNSSRGYDEHSSDNYGIEANKVLTYSYAEQAVKENLKSPKTAEFPSQHEKGVSIVDLENNEYRVTSWVDSQNGFGANIRSNFSVIIYYEGNSAKYKDLNIN